MARTPFKLKSGNAAAFKNLGSSPAKQGDRFAKTKTARKTRREESMPSEEYKPPTSEIDADQIANVKANYPGPEEKTADQTTNELNSDAKTPKANATQTKSPKVGTEKVSSDSPGPGWTKTKGTNIWKYNG